MESLEKQLLDIVMASPVCAPILEALPTLPLPQGYLCAGCITQSVLNHLYGMPPAYGIEDADIIYYDAGDLSFEAEDGAIKAVQAQLAAVPIRLDIKNEARVHLWYPEAFGYAIAPYKSCEDAIDSFPTTTTAVGVRHDGLRYAVYAPFGLEDLFSGTVRANKKQVNEAIYYAKAEKWKGKWPGLTVVAW